MKQKVLVIERQKMTKLVLFAIFAAAVKSQYVEDATLLRKFSAIVDMVNGQITTSFSYAEVVKRIQNYGCHCFPEGMLS